MSNGYQPPPYAPPGYQPPPGAPQAAPAPAYQQAPQQGYYPQPTAPQAPPGYGPPPGYNQAPPPPAAPPPQQWQQPPPGYQPHAAPPAPAPQYAPAPMQPTATPPWQQPTAPQAGGAGRFGGLKNAQAHASGNYFDVSKEGPGEFDCIIKDVSWKANGRKGALVIIELTVQQGTSPAVPPGTVKSVVHNTTSNPDVAWPQILAFLGACLGLDAGNSQHLQVINTNVKDDSERLMEQACDHKAFNGKPIHVSTMPHTTKGGPGKPPATITRVKFTPAAQAPGQ
jgi:hypothetical protein